MSQLLLRHETHVILGAAMEVYNTLGPGFLEGVYQEAEAQLLNYLKATGHPVGLLINFGAPGKLEWKRMAWTQKPATQLR